MSFFYFASLLLLVSCATSLGEVDTSTYGPHEVIVTNDWTPGFFGDKAVKVFREQEKSFDEAKSLCESYGAELFTFSSTDREKGLQEYNHLVKHVLGNKKYYRAWLGYMDNKEEKWRFVDASGRPFPFPGSEAPWYPGEPSGRGGSCIAMTDWGDHTFWDAVCSINLYALCQKKL